MINSKEPEPQNIFSSFIALVDHLFRPTAFQIILSQTVTYLNNIAPFFKFQVI